MSVIAVAGPSPLWYVTRGTGLVALVLLTAAVALGVLTSSRWQSPGWPRFASAGLHRNVSLLVVAFLAVHIVTAELDTFAPVGWAATALPFASGYRPLWLGLGTVACDLLVAVIVTSLLRARLGFQTWRIVHWLSYASWPVALVHGLGTGSDARLGWVQVLDAVCVVAVVGTVGWRLAQAHQPQLKLVGAAAVAVTALGVGLWAIAGPLKPGWAKRAGTPSNLLATSAAVATGNNGVTTTAPASGTASPSAGTTAAVPPLPFEAAIDGTVSQTGPDSSGQVTITIDTSVSGPMTGSLVIILRGQSAGGGVAMASSSVSFGPAQTPAEYRGNVVALNGDQLVVALRNSARSRIDLGVLLQIDPSSGSVHGTVHAGPAYSYSGSSGADGDVEGSR